MTPTDADNDTASLQCDVPDDDAACRRGSPVLVEEGLPMTDEHAPLTDTKVALAGGWGEPRREARKQPKDLWGRPFDTLSRSQGTEQKAKERQN